MGSVTQLTLLGAVLILLVSAATPVAGAGIGDRIFSGFLSFGRAFSNATQLVIGKVKTIVNPGAAERTRNRSIRDRDVFNSVCSLTGPNRRLLLRCLKTNDEEVLSPDWQSCIGTARIEVLTAEDLYHWMCMQITTSSQPENLQNTTECLLRGMDKPAVMDAIKECKGSSRPF
uniref:Putative secreted protein n=1 Tax=Ornithodoros turicata TaxID=34597 RepID=A0A2R5LL56_9ACAR